MKQTMLTGGLPRVAPFNNVNITTVSADIYRVRTLNNGKKAVIYIVPKDNVTLLSDNQVTSIASRDTKTIAKKIQPLCEGSCGGDDSGLCSLSVGDFDKKIVSISPSDGGDKLCKVDDVKDLTRNGKKMLGLSVSVNDFDGKGDAATANSALHLSNLSRKDNVKFTFVSTYSSFETVLNNLENVSILSTAVKAADFDENSVVVQGIFSGKKRYTVLAPPNNAFEKLPSGTVENLLKPENKSILRNLLYNHVFKGKLSVADIKNKKYLKAVSGKRFNVDVKEDGSVIVGGAKIVTPDVQILNVTVHVINRVLE